jgi:hypothetical protein
MIMLKVSKIHLQTPSESSKLLPKGNLSVDQSIIQKIIEPTSSERAYNAMLFIG